MAIATLIGPLRLDKWEEVMKRARTGRLVFRVLGIVCPGTQRLHPRAAFSIRNNSATVTLFSAERQTSGPEIFDSASLQVTNEIYDGVTSQFTRFFRVCTNTYHSSIIQNYLIRNYFRERF